MKITQFTQNLQTRRAAAKVSLATLAREVGISRQVAWSWENGRTAPAPEQLPALADALGCTVDDLVRQQKTA